MRSAGAFLGVQVRLMRLGTLLVAAAAGSLPRLALASGSPPATPPFPRLRHCVGAGRSRAPHYFDRVPRGGGASGGRARLPSELESEIAREHELECDATDYWTAGVRAECPPPPPIEFVSHALEGWTLPDFNPVLQKRSRFIHVTREPLFSVSECKDVTAAAEQFMRESHGVWTKLPSGRYEIMGAWVKDIPPVKAFFDHSLRTRLFPALVSLFPEFVDDVVDLVVQSAYLFK